MNSQNNPPAWLESAIGVRTPIHGTCFMGRAPTNTIVLTDDKVSRRHALIHAQGQEEFWLVDLGSSNGTYLNGRRVSLPSQLNDNDKVSVGNSVFAFRHPKAPTIVGPDRDSVEKTIQEIKSANCWLLLADIESSTQFLQNISQDELPMITGRWLAACKQIIDDNGGTINKYLGDGFFAYWQDREGIAASVAQALAAFKPLQAKEQPRFRVVLHFGQVMMGGAASMGEESLLGKEVNFAFRMEKLAASLGALRLMSEAAGAQLKSLTSTASEGRHPLSGFDGDFAFHSF
ncbi:MAG TPA: FHA domain-containing protein [Verrucomicrobiae bacterium]